MPDAGSQIADPGSRIPDLGMGFGDSGTRAMSDDRRPPSAVRRSPTAEWKNGRGRRKQPLSYLMPCTDDACSGSGCNTCRMSSSAVRSAMSCFQVLVEVRSKCQTLQSAWQSRIVQALVELCAKCQAHSRRSFRPSLRIKID